MNIQIYQVRPYDNFSFKKSYGSILASLNWVLVKKNWWWSLKKWRRE
jgi:hypothetical protein